MRLAQHKRYLQRHAFQGGSSTISRHSFHSELGHRFAKMITILQCLALLLWGIHCLAAEPPKDTRLTGTWSSGTGSVLTGEGFFRINNTFSVPKNTGISYSFVEKSDTTGFWEQAIYQYTRGDDPDCFTVHLIWQHGNYTIHRNNSMTLTPFKTDGLQQYTDTCKHEEDKIDFYSQPEFMKSFEITTYKHYALGADPQWSYKLQLYEFDGNPKPPMYLHYRPPLMYPTQPMHKMMWGLMG